ncbi:hypothetical protein Pelo_14720 [Pelomyxa schiedti]|nr:hypothetical protein Pelo_14720 [Pelomyxa schiedti]
MQKVPIESVIDARSQFVAFACASIQRCATAQPPPQQTTTTTPAASFFYRENPALFAEFGRQWVAGCSRQVAATLIRSQSRDTWPCVVTRVNVFVGLSATLGVVWCAAWTPPRSVLATAVPIGDWTVHRTLGDDRFLVTGGVIDRSGGVVAPLEVPARDVLPAYGVWVGNHKWLVCADPGIEMAVWRMGEGGAQVGGGPSLVTCTAPMYGVGARFSPFDPFSDELVAVGQGDDGSARLSFINLEKSIISGVSEVTATRILPQSRPFDLVWAAPDTILTLHMGGDNRVYNTKTGELHVFPLEKYKGVDFLSPSHISALLQDTTGRCKVADVFSASDLCHPLPQMECWESDPASRIHVTDPGIVAVQMASDNSKNQGRVAVHDSITGKSIVILSSLLGEESNSEEGKVGSQPLPIEDTKKDVYLLYVFGWVLPEHPLLSFFFRNMLTSVVDAGSQFVALACASIDRCGRGSAAARFVASGNPALLAEFGRRWVVACARQVGSTLLLTPSSSSSRAHTKAHVFMGLSATMGVVWCKCWGESASTRDWIVQVTVGGDRFVATDNWREAWVIDGGGGVVSPLRSQVHAPVISFWANNEKWLVRVDSGSERKKLIVWRMSGGEPVGPGVGVECTEGVSGVCAKFSPFSAFGDELVFSSSEDTCAFLSAGRESLSFVDIDKSIASGVTVVTKEYPLPLINLIDFVWADPDTILTMHSDTDSIVYNTKTGESKVFPVSQYQRMEAISPEHIAFSLGSTGTTNERRTTVRVVYSARDLSHPSHQYERQNSSFRVHSTEKGIYVAEMDNPRTVVIHDSITGTPLAFLTIS